jgi:HEAT repeat protein
MIKSVRTACMAISILLAVGGCAINQVASSGYTPSKSPQEIQQALSQGKVIPLQVREKIIMLYDPEPLVRASAAYKLGKIGRGAAPAVPYLVELLGDPSPVLLSSYLGGGYHSSFDTSPADEASRALANIGDAASQALIEAAQSENANTRRLAARALGQIGGLNSIPQLIKLLDDQQQNVRAAAAIALGNFHHPRAAQMLMDALPAASASARADMIYALAHINDIISVPFLIERLPNEEPKVRAAIVYTLGKSRDARATRVLLASLSDEDATVRANGVHALGNYYSPEVIEALLTMLDDQVQQVNEAAVEALFMLTGKDYGLDKAKWQQWWQQQKQAIQN